MAGNFDFLHIKRRTAGSSNELSLDVLEHKSAEADDRAARGSKLPKMPKASRGSFHGVAGTSTLSGQAEVEKRKKARRSYRLRVQAIGAVVIVALVAFGVYAGVRYYQDGADLAGRVHALVNRLAEIDETLVEIDAMVIDPFNADEADERKSALAAMPQMTTDLNRISVDAQSLLELPVDDRTQVVIGQIGKSSQSRSAMIEAAADAFRLSSEASAQVDRANGVWNDVLAADQLAREAIAASNKATTQEATSQALDQLRSARQGFADAWDELGDMEAQYGIDFGGQVAYLQKKVEALGFAVETSEALLAGDRDAATQANEAYNEADGEAVQLAGDLPPSIGGIVQDRFDALMLERQRRYEDARDSTVNADSVIREYLGQ